MHILDPDSRDSATTSFLITMQSHLIWSHNDRFFGLAFVLANFGPKVQAEATILQDLKTAKIKAKMTTFLKPLGPCRKEK